MKPLELTRINQRYGIKQEMDLVIKRTLDSRINDPNDKSTEESITSELKESVRRVVYRFSPMSFTEMYPEFEKWFKLSLKKAGKLLIIKPEPVKVRK